MKSKYVFYVTYSFPYEEERIIKNVFIGRRIGYVISITRILTRDFIENESMSRVKNEKDFVLEATPGVSKIVSVYVLEYKEYIDPVTLEKKYIFSKKTDISHKFID